MTPVRVLVVEDSLTVRERLAEVLASDPGFEVVGLASDGLEALRRYESAAPDVISLDMVLPGCSGLEVTRRIMSTRATPILVVSASVNRGEAFDALDALRAGAVDLFDKSRLGTDPGWTDAYRSALRLVSRIRVVTRPSPRTPSPPDPATRPPPAPTVSEGAAPYRLVVLGASTGGPAALARVLAELPRDFGLPSLIVLHLASLFATPLVEWLGKQVSLPVRLVADGEPLPSPGPGAPVLLAPPDRHLVVQGARLRLTTDPERHACRPSVDVLFESVAREFGQRAIAGLLTGMGRDGAAGLLALRQAGAFTLAQDEATSAVFGMPRAAIERGAAQAVLPLGAIAATLDRLSRAAEERKTD